MAEKTAKDTEKWETYESPLKAWPGSFSLPPLDDVDGDMWKAWQRCVGDAPGDGLNRLYCYAGLAFVKQYGRWQMDISLAEVQSWQKDPKAERLRLVSWIGARVQAYIGEIVNPKG